MHDHAIIDLHGQAPATRWPVRREHRFTLEAALRGISADREGDLSHSAFKTEHTKQDAFFRVTLRLGALHGILGLSFLACTLLAG